MTTRKTFCEYTGAHRYIKKQISTHVLERHRSERRLDLQDVGTV